MKKYIGLFCAISVLMSCTNNPTEDVTDQLAEQIQGEDPNQHVFTAELNLPTTAFDYSSEDFPDHFMNMVNRIDNTPENNPVTDGGATLGRVLFYDNILSQNNTISCASCHIQANGFSDPNQLSTGFDGGLTGRNSMGLSNARFYDNGKFFWDERAATLEEQVLMPIQDQVEMGLTLDELVSKIQSAKYYEPLFVEAFGTNEITTDRISKAMAQFVRSMVSYESPYDTGLSAVNGDENSRFPNFTELENLGKDLFFSGRTQCSTCHETAVFSGDEARNNGLIAGFPDLGLGAVTGNARDNGKFKVNSLRNVELTAPYMHDGSLGTLRQVIEFYNNGIRDNPNLDNRLRVMGNRVRRMNLNGREIDALVAFLGTLTDESFINEEKFSNPFTNR